MSTTSTNPSSNQTPRKRKFRTEAEWRDLIRQFEESNLTQTAFCKQQGIATSGLNRWRQRLTDNTPAIAPASQEPSGFVQLGALPDPSVSPSADHSEERRWQVELEFAPGRTLKIAWA